MSEAEVWRVAVNAPLAGPLSYLSSFPPGTMQPGDSVSVPLGARRVEGVAIDRDPAPTGEFALKEITAINEGRPRLSEERLAWLRWLASYYQYPLGQVTQLAFPPLSKPGKARKNSVTPLVPERAPPQLTAEQAQAIGALEAHLVFSVHLLFGVTGSGKTEIYLRLLAAALARGQQGLVLVPEISLTPQLIERFSARFGPEVAVLHSHLTEREKTNQWWHMVKQEKRILVGARSALFCPMPKLGIIIVDEEHEGSYKQEEKLKYHARDAAIMLAQKVNCPIVLGSATPSLESWENAQRGRYHLHRLRQRVENRALPHLQIVDLREKKEAEKDAKADRRATERPFWLSAELFAALSENYRQGYQAALFLNRRGIAQAVTCPACGTTSECPNCAVSLTLHARTDLLCHYCDYHENLLEECRICHSGAPTPFGLGTEKVSADLATLFPQANIARADRDEIQNRGDLEELIKNMETGEINFLVGTQMIAKGLDFPKLKLVGLVLADVGFHLPDFRSSERSFQLITQVAGRAGRHVVAGESPGQVFIQTYNPDHAAIQFALTHDFEGFAQQELSQRKIFLYPPFGRLASVRLLGSERALTEKTALQLAQRAQQLRQQQPSYLGLEILGPSEAPLAKLRGQHRFHLLLKSSSAPTLGSFCQQLLFALDKWRPARVKVQLDMDPVQLL